MPRSKVALIFGSKPNYNSTALKYFLLHLNKLQLYYEFVFPDISGYPFEESEYSSDDLFAYFEGAQRSINFRADYWIFFVTSTISGNYFAASSNNVSFISTDIWDRYLSPPSLFEYLLNTVIGCLLVMQRNPDFNLSFHTDTRGCIFDYNRLKHDNRADIALGYICDEDSDKIKSAMGNDFLTNIQSILNREWIGFISVHGSVAYNLQHIFHFNIEKDSGFNKTFWERARTKFDDLPKDFITILLTSILTAIVTAVLFYFGMK